MAFLERQVLHERWVRIEGPHGTEHLVANLAVEIVEYTTTHLVPVPGSLHGRCRNTLAWSIRLVQGWGARIAPFGLLDRTPWTFFVTQHEAERYLDYVAYLYGDGHIQVFGQG